MNNLSDSELLIISEILIKIIQNDLKRKTKDVKAEMLQVVEKEYAKLIESGAQKSIYKIITPQTVKNKEKALKWVKSLEIPESVELCIGAQVVVLANLNQDAGIVNGTRGVVINLKNKSVIIKRVDNSIFEVEYFKTTNFFSSITIIWIQ
jgi:hypothetical protein